MDNTLTITPEARETIRRMRNRCVEIAAMFGPDTDYAKNADASLRTCLAEVLTFGTGNSRVMQDGELSLIVHNEGTGYTFGVNWSRKPVTGQEAHALRSWDRDPEDFFGTWSVNS
jgi:hypothetical protein